MKLFKKIKKEELYLFILTVIVMLASHMPLFTKKILSADIILNNNYYDAYSWEISLGRFGLYILGIIKGFFVIDQIEVFLSIILTAIISIVLIRLFDIKKAISKVLICLFNAVVPSISALLVFNYCSFSYLLSIFLAIMSVYVIKNIDNKYIKNILFIIFNVISLSIYQAFISVTISIIMLLFIKDLVNKKEDYKELFLNVLRTIICIVIYYILMKITLVIFNINLSDYTGASSIGFGIISQIPNRIVECYKTFYTFYFKNTILKNTYMKNSLINLIIFIILSASILYNMLKNKVNIKKSLLIIILILLVPIYFNFVLIMTPESKMQLLMANTYILLIPFLFSFPVDKKIFNIVTIVLIIVLLRNYFIQDNATYKVLEMKYNKTYNLLSNVINNIDLDKEVLIAGDLNTKYENISNLDYGFVADIPLFWDNYTNLKNGWERFSLYEMGTKINYVDIEKFNNIIKKDEYKNLKHNEIKLIDDVYVVKLK